MGYFILKNVCSGVKTVENLSFFKEIALRGKRKVGVRRRERSQVEYE